MIFLKMQINVKMVISHFLVEVVFLQFLCDYSLNMDSNAVSQFSGNKLMMVFSTFLQ